MTSQTLDTLVGRRFKNLEDIKQALKNIGASNPDIHFYDGEEDEFEDNIDLCIDGVIDIESNNDRDYFTLHYIVDRVNQFYITETRFWQS